MGFGNRGNKSTGKSTVDWEGLNKYVVDTCDLEDEEVITGVVTGLIDVGLQEQEDAQMLFTGTEEEEQAEIDKGTGSYFEDLPDYNDGGKVKRYKRWPQKAVCKVVTVIDFPSIILDKGPFFGSESNPAPLRMILGGEFTPKGGKTISSRPVDLSIRKNDKTNNKWSFQPNHTFYKMAVGAKLIKKGDAFLPDNIEDLLGQSFQFKVQVGFNKKDYFFEKCVLQGGLARGMSATEFDESLLHCVLFDQENDEDALKQLRQSVINTMELSSEFDESEVKKQLVELKRYDDGSPSKVKQEDNKPEAKKEAKASSPHKIEEESTEDSLEDDVPF